MSNEVSVELSWCKGCGICAAFCPKEVFRMDMEREKVVIEHPEACVGCGTCERMCPDLAITEAAVGAGVTSLLFFLALRKINALKGLDRDETP